MTPVERDDLDPEVLADPIEDDGETDQPVVEAASADEKPTTQLVPAGGRSLVPADPFRRYLAEIRKYPPLDRDEERELASRLTTAQHEHHDLAVSTLHVHLNHDDCLETVVINGPTEQVSDDYVISARSREEDLAVPPRAHVEAPSSPGAPVPAGRPRERRRSRRSQPARQYA